MRWKIIFVNAGIVIVLGLLTYALLATSLGSIVADPTARKAEVAHALRAANAQFAVDALRLERWLANKVTEPDVQKVYLGGTPQARSEQATTAANRLRDQAIQEPDFAKIAPSLVLFVDEQGVTLGRNGSALMRGDKTGEAYPSLLGAIKSGKTASDVWLDKSRQEQMLASYAPVRGEDGSVVGAVVVGTPLNDERLSRTSELTSGQSLALSSKDGVIAAGGAGANKSAFGNAVAKEAAAGALKSSNLIHPSQASAGRLYGAVRLEGYGEAPVVLVASVAESLVPIGDLLWPVAAISGLGLLLVIVGGFLLGNYISGPVAELEDGLLAIINGNQELRLELEHAELGGLVFRINSLLNALMGVPEDTTDEAGRPSGPPSAHDFKEALAVDESSVTSQNVDPAVAQALAQEPAEQYYARLCNEYIAAKQQLGDPVDHITPAAFRRRIEASEREMRGKHGRPVRYQVQLRDGAVVLIAVPLG